MLESVMSYMAPMLMPLSFEEEASDLTTYEWRWMAPELLAVEEESIPLVTAATDVYSFAMTAIEVCIYLPLFSFCVVSHLLSNCFIDHYSTRSILAYPS